MLDFTITYIKNILNMVNVRKKNRLKALECRNWFSIFFFGSSIV